MRFLDELLVPAMVLTLLGAVYFAGEARAGEEQTANGYYPAIDPTLAGRIVSQYAPGNADAQDACPDMHATGMRTAK